MADRRESIYTLHQLKISPLPQCLYPPDLRALKAQGFPSLYDLLNRTCQETHKDKNLQIVTD